jgi:uncharacterized protein (DUF952 family)
VSEVSGRWLYHALPASEWERAGDPYAPASLASEGFVHTSYRDRVRESATLYVRPPCVILRIDPRALAARIEVAATPRGPMPHVFGSVPRAAVAEVVPLEAWDEGTAPDRL